MALTCLEQREHFKAFVLRAESAWKERRRMRLLEEHELAGEKVFEHH